MQGSAKAYKNYEVLCTKMMNKKGEENVNTGAGCKKNVSYVAVFQLTYHVYHRAGSKGGLVSEGPGVQVDAGFMLRTFISRQGNFVHKGVVDCNFIVLNGLDNMLLLCTSCGERTGSIMFTDSVNEHCCVCCGWCHANVNYIGMFCTWMVREDVEHDQFGGLAWNSCKTEFAVGFEPCARGTKWLLNDGILKDFLFTSLGIDYVFKLV